MTNTRTAPKPTEPNEKAAPPENATDSDQDPGHVDLYAVVFDGPDGSRQLEWHTDHTAEARVRTLTYGSKQSRKEAEAEGAEIPEGGGTHEINRDDIHVFKLNAAVSKVTDF